MNSTEFIENWIQYIKEGRPNAIIGLIILLGVLLIVWIDVGTMNFLLLIGILFFVSYFGHMVRILEEKL